MATRAAVAAPRFLRRFFCTNPASSSFPFVSTPSTGDVPTPARPTAEPNTNLFVSDGSIDRYETFLVKKQGLSKRTTTEKLREEFSKFGEVVHARVVTDRVSGYSKGFGFVQYSTIEEAAKGIEGMDGKIFRGYSCDADWYFPNAMQFLDGWVIFAEYARPRPPPGQYNNSPQFGRHIIYKGMDAQVGYSIVASFLYQSIDADVCTL
ncbi:unnamed protein product [Sphenostylis stenocarpa]|uniref:RRM domain-containing protein n=1 Tax=Sphenostylis stenocarpa TaxID=92480 RepID=A0AA86W691_9FABA|nr:unnamed protein product [Sphenostylis stenocarpa]